MGKQGAYVVTIHLKVALNGVKSVTGNSFTPSLAIEMGFVTLFKNENHIYSIPEANIAYVEYMKEAKNSIE